MTSPTAAVERSLERLFIQHHGALVRYLTRMTRCAQRAEDLAQVAWLKVLSAYSRGACAVAEETELRAYLFTVARNAFLDEYTRKHEALRTRCVDPQALDGLAGAVAAGPGPDQEVERMQVRAVVRGAVARLPAEQRKVIGLWSGGASIRDMAATCHAPRDTVLSRKKYAVARLRTMIEPGLCAAG